MEENDILIMKELTILMKYDPKKNKKEKSNRIRIFGKVFVKNNENNENIKMSLGVNNNEEEFLREYLEPNEYNKNNIIEIQLFIKDSLFDFNNMYCECFSLKSIEVKNLKTIQKPIIIKVKEIINKNINIDNSNEESGFSQLSSIPSIEDFYDDSFISPFYFKFEMMFYQCESLESISNDFFNKLILKLNANTIERMSKIFSGCNSLKSLPDITNLNTEKVGSFDELFFGCKSLEYLPDISK